MLTVQRIQPCIHWTLHSGLHFDAVPATPLIQFYSAADLKWVTFKLNPRRSKRTVFAWVRNQCSGG